VLVVHATHTVLPSVTFPICSCPIVVLCSIYLDSSCYHTLFIYTYTFTHIYIPYYSIILTGYCLQVVHTLPTLSPIASYATTPAPTSLPTHHHTTHWVVPVEGLPQVVERVPTCPSPFLGFGLLLPWHAVIALDIPPCHTWPFLGSRILGCAILGYWPHLYSYLVPTHLVPGFCYHVTLFPFILQLVGFLPLDYLTYLPVVPFCGYVAVGPHLFCCYWILPTPIKHATHCLDYCVTLHTFWIPVIHVYRLYTHLV